MPAIPNSNQNSRLPAHSHRLWFPAAVALLAARDGFLYGLDDDLPARVENPSGVRKWNDGRYASGQAVLVDDQVIVRSEPAPVALVEAGPDSFEELGRIPALNGKTWIIPPSLAVTSSCETARRRVATSSPVRPAKPQLPCINVMDINSSAPASASHEITIEAPLEVVWNLIAEIDRWCVWNPAISKAKLNGQFTVGTTFNWKSNGFAIHSTLQEIAPLSRLVWTGKAPGTSAIHVWTFQSVGNAVRVSTRESFEGWLVKLLRGSMQKTLDRALNDWLERLKLTAEK